MHTVSASAPRRTLPFTQRQLYFFLLWLPLPLGIFLYPAIYHLPFAIVHSWKARKKPTLRLLHDSWAVPFKIAAFSLLPTAASFAYEQLFTDHLANWSVRWRWTLTTAALCFAAAFVVVCFGWLLLITVARRWPRDWADAASP